MVPRFFKAKYICGDWLEPGDDDIDMGILSTGKPNNVNLTHTQTR